MCSSHSYHLCMVSSHPAWIHASSQSFASNSETHYRFWASIIPFDLILFSRSLMIAILSCCFISSSYVSSSCLHCRRCKLYSLNKEKIPAQQSSHNFLKKKNFSFCVLLSIPRGHRCLWRPLSCSLQLCTCPGLSSSILSANLFQQRSISIWFRLLHLFISSVSSSTGTFILVRSSFLWGFPPSHLVTFVHSPPAQVLFV